MATVSKPKTYESSASKFADPRLNSTKAVVLADKDAEGKIFFLVSIQKNQIGCF